jgi:fructose-bisphosphate aldolase class I
MVEPEVLIDGEHTIEQCYEVTETTLEEVFEELAHQNVAPEGVILKASMVIAGKKATKQSSVEEVADQTVRVLKATVPKELAGVVFLSGGQGDEQATAHLNAMNAAGNLPWPLSFSYSRAIQNLVLVQFAKDQSDLTKVREILLFRAKMNSLAALGKYSDEMEKQRPY